LAQVATADGLTFQPVTASLAEAATAGAEAVTDTPLALSSLLTAAVTPLAVREAVNSAEV
jgi:hypothetical protein